MKLEEETVMLTSLQGCSWGSFPGGKTIGVWS